MQLDETRLDIPIPDPTTAHDASPSSHPLGVRPARRSRRTTAVVVALLAAGLTLVGARSLADLSDASPADDQAAFVSSELGGVIDDDVDLEPAPAGAAGPSEDAPANLPQPQGEEVPVPGDEGDPDPTPRPPIPATYWPPVRRSP
jgi:hypothetical protein